VAERREHGDAGFVGEVEGRAGVEGDLPGEE
jgi:hypothetical protein